MSAYAYGETTLRIPLFVNGIPSSSKAKQNKKKQTDKIPMVWFNSTLKKKGIKPLPESVEFTPGDKFSMDDINAEVEAVATKLGPDYKNLEIAGETLPNDNKTAKFKTCYTGRGDGVWNAVIGLADMYYSEQMGLWGWKYKDTIKYTDDQDLKATKEMLKDDKLWKNWRGDDDAVLIALHVGDGGDDVQDIIIDRCDD
jgi:hypothetical protein